MEGGCRAVMKHKDGKAQPTAGVGLLSCVLPVLQRIIEMLDAKCLGKASATSSAFFVLCDTFLTRRATWASIHAKIPPLRVDARNTKGRQVVRPKGSFINMAVQSILSNHTFGRPNIAFLFWSGGEFDEGGGNSSPNENDLLNIAASFPKNCACIGFSAFSTLGVDSQGRALETDHLKYNSFSFTMGTVPDCRRSVFTWFPPDGSLVGKLDDQLAALESRPSFFNGLNEKAETHAPIPNSVGGDVQVQKVIVLAVACYDELSVLLTCLRRRYVDVEILGGVVKSTKVLLVQNGRAAFQDITDGVAGMCLWGKGIVFNSQVSRASKSVSPIYEVIQHRKFLNPESTDQTGHIVSELKELNDDGGKTYTPTEILLRSGKRNFDALWVGVASKECLEKGRGFLLSELHLAHLQHEKLWLSCFESSNNSKMCRQCFGEGNTAYVQIFESDPDNERFHLTQNLSMAKSICEKRGKFPLGGLIFTCTARGRRMYKGKKV